MTSGAPPAWTDQYTNQCVTLLFIPRGMVPRILRYIRGAVPSIECLTPRRRDQAVALYHAYVEMHTPVGEHN